MNSGQFYQYLSNPHRLGIHDEVQLRGLIKEYPYFQAAHVLLAKCLKNMDNYMFEKQLKTAAVFAPNRSLLYQLLKSKAGEDSVVASTPALAAVATEEPEAPVEQEKPVAEMPTNTYEVFSIEPETEPEYKHSFRPEPEPTPRAVLKDNPVLVEMPAAIVEESKVTETGKSEPEELAKPESEDEANSAVTISTTPAGDVIEEARSGQMSFTEWLNTTSPRIESPLMVNLPDPGFASGKTDFAASMQNRLPLQPLPPATDTDAILENFVNSNPTITRSKAAFFDPIKSAKKSVEEDEDIATETLARIVLKQGNASKAIRIYEKLILKIPTKETIFATQIAKIKQDYHLT